MAAGPPAGVPAWARADLYDWETATVNRRGGQDVAFYRSVVAASPAGPVLELAAGTGRVAGPLADSTGRWAVGTDIDQAVLARLATRLAGGVGGGAGGGASGRAGAGVAADMRAGPFRAGAFGAVLIPYNSLQLLPTDDDRHACLADCAALLAPGGLLAFEVSDFQGGGAAPLPATTVWEAAVELGGRMCDLELVAGVDHDPVTRVTVYRRRWRVQTGAPVGTDHAPGAISEWTEWEDDLTLRSLDRDEAVDLLAHASLTTVRVESDAYRHRVVARVQHRPA